VLGGGDRLAFGVATKPTSPGCMMLPLSLFALFVALSAWDEERNLHPILGEPNLLPIVIGIGLALVAVALDVLTLLWL